MGERGVGADSSKSFVFRASKIGGQGCERGR